MNWIDWLIIAVIGLSTIIGIMRGFVKEALSLVVWIGAMVIATSFCEDLLRVDSPLKPFLTETITQPQIQLSAAFVLLFLATLIVGGLFNFMIGRLIASSALAGFNRMLGMFFGLMRGAVIVAMIVVAVQSTPLGQHIAWQASLLVHPLAQWSQQLLTQLSGVIIT